MQLDTNPSLHLAQTLTLSTCDRSLYHLLADIVTGPINFCYISNIKFIEVYRIRSEIDFIWWITCGRNWHMIIMIMIIIIKKIRKYLLSELPPVSLAPPNPTHWRREPQASIQKSFSSSAPDWFVVVRLCKLNRDLLSGPKEISFQTQFLRNCPPV